MMRWLLMLSMLLSACAGPFGITGASPEQLKELARIKDATATCVKGVYAGATVTITAFDVDKGIPSGLTIGENCQMTFQTTPTTKVTP